MGGAQIYGAATSGDSRNQLHKAIQRGDEQQVRALLQNPTIDPNYKAPADPRSTRLRSGGNTPLHEALKKLREKNEQKYLKIARLLINQETTNASINNDAGATPLHMLAGFVPERNPAFPQAERLGEISNNEETRRPDLAEIAKELIDELILTPKMKTVERRFTGPQIRDMLTLHKH